MSRLNTTIWDLANAIFEAAEAEGGSDREIDVLASVALINSLDRAILVDTPMDIDRRPQRLTPVPTAVAI